MDNTTVISKGFYVTGEEKVRVNLVTGLEFVIARLEERLQSDPHVMLDMFSFVRCALGRGLPERVSNENYLQLIKKYFGVKPTILPGWYECALDSVRVNTHFTRRTAKVMNLFTTNVGSTITIKTWVEQANKVLLELKETK